MLKKAALTIVVLLNLLIPSLVSAAPVDNTSKLPELNPFCWQRSDCYDVRKQFIVGNSSDEELEQGFITDDSVAPCVGGTGENQWGRCLPAGVSKTEISFGGKSEFTNIGEFLVVMYKYLLTIASIVAVVVIIIAGAQWITSGGNSEAIGSAKKRIGGAVIGLFIAYMSYFVLNTINPALVNLRLPQVWLVKPMALTPEFCSDLEKEGQEGKTKFMYGASSAEQTKPISLDIASKTSGFTDTNPTANEKFACGSRFFVASGGQSPCRGTYCDPNSEGGHEENTKDNQKACWDLLGDRKNYECGAVRIGGHISYSATVKKGCGGAVQTTFERAGGLAADYGFGVDVFGNWACKPVVGEHLVLVCEDAEEIELSFSGWTLGDEIACGVAGGGEDQGGIVSKRSGQLYFGDGDGESSFNYHVKKNSATLKSSVDALCGGQPKGFVLGITMEEETVGCNERSRHFVGKGGVDLGNNFGFWSYAHRIDPKYLFSVDEVLKGGVRLNFDAAKIAPGSGVDRYEKYLQ